MTRRFISRALSLPAASLVMMVGALGVAACAQATPSEPSPLAGIDDKQYVAHNLKIANGLCFQQGNDDKGWFITNPRKCASALGR